MRNKKPKVLNIIIMKYTLYLHLIKYVGFMRRPKWVGQVSQGDEQLPEERGDIPVKPQVRELQSTLIWNGTTQSKNGRTGSGSSSTQVSRKKFQKKHSLFKILNFTRLLTFFNVLMFER